MSEPLPHCELCDRRDCDGIPAMRAEASYIEHAGLKPEAPIMRSAWEHSLMIWCRAQREATK